MKTFTRKISMNNLAFAILFVVIVALVISLIATNNRINSLTSTVVKQSTTISSLSERVKKYTYNPSSLTECLNDASHEYTNYISTHGTPVPNEKGVGYSMDSDQWQVAESSLKKHQGECNLMFSNK